MATRSRKRKERKSQPLTYSQVVREVDRWMDSQAMEAYRSMARDNWDEVLMHNSPPLPDTVVVRAQMHSDAPTALTLETAQTVVAEFDSFTEYFTVVPKNAKATQPLKDAADRIERYVSVKFAELDHGGNKKREGWQNQLISSYDIYHLVCHGVDAEEEDDLDEELDIWEFEKPDLQTCGFPIEHGGAFVPRVFARKYRALVDDVMDTYSDYGGSGKGLKFDDNGTPEYKPLEEISIGETENVRGKYVTVYYLEKDGRIYHCCSAVEGSEYGHGEVLHKGEILSGMATNAIIIPGDTTPSREPGAEMIAAMEALIATAKHINFLVAFRQTVALSVMPDGVLLTSAQFEAAKELGVVVPASAAQIAAGGPNLITLTGEKFEPWTPVKNEDISAITAEKRVEFDRLINAWTTNYTPEVMAAATATASTITAAVQARRKTTVVKMQDHGRALLGKMMVNSMKAYKGMGRFVAYAMDTIQRERGDDLKAGDMTEVRDSDLENDYEVYVATRQETQEQKAARLAEGMTKEQADIITHEQLIGIEFSDTSGQLEELLTDKILKIADAVTPEVIAMMMRDVAYTESAYLLDTTRLVSMLQQSQGIVPPEQQQAQGQQSGAVETEPPPAEMPYNVASRQPVGMTEQVQGGALAGV